MLRSHFILVDDANLRGLVITNELYHSMHPVFTRLLQMEKLYVWASHSL
jgi:hypothetical protein